MSYKKAEALLAAVIISRATSLLIIKTCLGGFTTFNLMALRFSLAFLCLAPFIRKHFANIRRTTLCRGIVLGALFFAIIAIELTGLRLTDSSAVVSFLENTAIVLVPLAEAALHARLPHRQNLLCALLAAAGVGFLLLSGKQAGLSAGALVCLCSAFLYTGYIIMTDRLSRRDDPLLLGFLAIGTVGLLSLAASFLRESPRLPENPKEALGIFLLAVVCSSIGTALQPLAQRYVPSEKACIFCALNPLATCVMGWIFLGEWQGLSGVLGAVCILSAIILSRMKLPERRPVPALSAGSSR